MKRLCLVLLVALLSLFTHASHARKAKIVNEYPEEYINEPLPNDANVWYCWYNGNAHIHCTLGELTQAESNTDSSAKAPAVPDVSTLSRLPEAVQRIWHKAASVAGRYVNIPLHSPPFDMALTGELAKSVVCGGTTSRCGIIFGRNAQTLSSLIETRATMLAAMNLGPVALNTH